MRFYPNGKEEQINWFSKNFINFLKFFIYNFKINLRKLIAENLFFRLKEVIIEINIQICKNTENSLF